MEKQNPFIRVTEKGKNFKLIDSEFQLNGSNRPILETSAENTQVIRTRVITGLETIKKHKWLSALLVTVVAGLVLLFIEYGLFVRPFPFGI
jgi:hypothetical protein